ncbi:MAG: ParB/RepB/Spo0J family partition protein [Nitrososphaerota archaeon]|jgi:ParB-like chromosome segregation protein Spo0J|nr:ParB/RepB/Spo0J family partition protein [Nitrososphaerota archaeon]
MSLRLNPQYEKMLPMMSQEEFEQLKESIRTEGQHYPVIVSESLEVLDGHHRFRACLELGIEPDFEVKHFEDKLLETKFVIEANLRRRHLNNFQLVELAVPLLEIEKAIAKKHYSQNDKNKNYSSPNPVSAESFSEFEPTGKTTAAVAKKAGVSTRTLERGKKIIEKASEDDKQKLREGKTSINKVYRDIAPPKSVQKTPFNSETLLFDPQILRNRDALAAILQSIIKQDISCPECGNKIFQCSQCHKSLNELVKFETPSKKTAKEPQEQPQNLESDKSTEDGTYPLGDDERFRDEFF